MRAAAILLIGHGPDEDPRKSPGPLSVPHSVEQVKDVVRVGPTGGRWIRYPVREPVSGGSTPVEWMMGRAASGLASRATIDWSQ